MPKTIKIDPITRIEGHLKVDITVENQFVIDSSVSGQMYRGMERLLVGRSPLDAARISQRTCGVCHEVHGVASVKALEQLYEIEVPTNGKILRNIIIGLQIVADHLLHFYQMCTPDYVDFSQILKYKGDSRKVKDIKNWYAKSGKSFLKQPRTGKFILETDTAIHLILNYFNAMEIRSSAAAGIAVIGAKTPFAHAVLPGGITTKITTDTLTKCNQHIQQVTDFVNEQFLPDVLSIASVFPEYFHIGKTYDRFYGNEAFESETDSLYQSGIYTDHTYRSFDINQVKEVLDASYYSADKAPNADKTEAYSWIKAIRYANMPIEVGPIARLVINEDLLFKQYTQQNTHISSVMSRLIARAIDSKNILQSLSAQLNQYQLTESAFNHQDLTRPVTGSASGYTIASRGALSHHITAEKGKITGYQMIVPSTWNFGPTVQGQKGIVEKALIGCPVGRYQASDSVEVGRIIRSFDPCTACSVH